MVHGESSSQLERCALFCSSRFFLYPGTHCFLILFTEPRLWVHRGVLPGRHPSRRNKSADGFQLVLPLPLRIRVPPREIQAFPAFADVLRNPPGDGWNVAVPRPVSAIRVAVSTSAHQDVQRFYVQRHWHLLCFGFSRIPTCDSRLSNNQGCGYQRGN